MQGHDRPAVILGQIAADDGHEMRSRSLHGVKLVARTQIIEVAAIAIIAGGRSAK